jgi:hypothetical protein
MYRIEHRRITRHGRNAGFNNRTTRYCIVPTANGNTCPLLDAAGNARLFETIDSARRAGKAWAKAQAQEVAA